MLDKLGPSTALACQMLLKTQCQREMTTCPSLMASPSHHVAPLEDSCLLHSGPLPHPLRFRHGSAVTPTPSSWWGNAALRSSGATRRMTSPKINLTLGQEQGLSLHVLLVPTRLGSFRSLRSSEGGYSEPYRSMDLQPHCLGKRQRAFPSVTGQKPCRVDITHAR